MSSSSTSKLFSFSSSNQSTVNVCNSTYKQGAYYTLIQVVGGTKYIFPLPDNLSDQIDMDWNAADTDVVMTNLAANVFGRVEAHGGIQGIWKEITGGKEGNAVTRTMDVSHDIIKTSIDATAQNFAWSDIIKNWGIEKVMSLPGISGFFDEGSKKFISRLAMDGKIKNKNTTLYFDGVKLREGELTFSLTPFSSSEATTMKSAIEAIKTAALPSLSKDKYFFNEPSKFNIAVYVGTHAIWTRTAVAFKKIDVNYYSSDPAFHSDGSPITYKVGISWNDSMIYTKSGYSAAVSSNGSSSSASSDYSKQLEELNNSGKYWNDLSASQRTLAANLGYNEEEWNNKVLSE